MKRVDFTLNEGKRALRTNTQIGDIIVNVLGAVTINANSEINGELRAPNGAVTHNSSRAIVRGNIWVDGFTLSGKGQVLCPICLNGSSN